MTKKVDTFPVSSNDFYKTNGGEYVVFNREASLTRQEFAEECDINAIMKRYEGKDIGALMRRDLPPQYADFTTLPGNLLEYMEFMSSAESAFMTLPAGVRRQFGNSAHEFVEFASDPSSLEQMRAWGLAPPAKPQPEPPEKPVEYGSRGPAAPPPPVAPRAPGGAGGDSTHGST